MANITYRQVADYMIPNLTLPPEESAVRLGKWGKLHKDYIQKHNPVLFATLLTQGNLYQHCAQIDTQAQKMFNTLVEPMIKVENITEELKEEHQMEWVAQINNIRNRATDIVNHNIIHT